MLSILKSKWPHTSPFKNQLVKFVLSANIFEYLISVAKQINWKHKRDQSYGLLIQYRILNM